MTNAPFAKLRSFLVRGLAVVAVLFTYALGNVGTQVLATVGVSTLALSTSSQPAQAGWRRRRWRRRRWRRRRWWW